MKTFLSCQRILAVLFMLALASVATAHTAVIRISTVEQLYDAMNNPANAGATLQLAPGTYFLTATDSSGNPRPNDGRLELQPDMSLTGREGNRSAVTIDAVNLPASSFPQTVNGVQTGPSAAIRLGLGHNALEWLTVRNAQAAQANIDTGLQWLDPGTAYVRVAHVASTGSTRGLNVLNFGPQTSGQTIEADIIDCQFYDNVLNLSEGVRLGNFQGAVGSTIKARMFGNSSWGQKQGRLIVNNRATQSTINVVSVDNRFHDNGGGTIISGGLSSNNTRADYNTIDFKSYGDQFVDNTGATDLDHGGLVVLGLEDTSAATGGGSFNMVNVDLWNATLRGNDTADLTGIGARALSAATAPNSQSNHVVIQIHDIAGDGHARGHAPQPVESFSDRLPAEPNYDNSVTVTQCRDRPWDGLPFLGKDWWKDPRGRDFQICSR